MKKYVDAETTNAWVMAFALIPRPDVTTLYALVPLLDFEHQIPDAQFILSYSAVVHAYCATQEGNCAGLALRPIEEFLKRMETIIEKGCLPRSHDVSEIKQVRKKLATKDFRCQEEN